MALRQVERTGQSTPARAGKSSSAEAPLPSDEASTPAIGPRGPRPARQRPFAAPPPGARPPPEPARPPRETAPTAPAPATAAVPGEKDSINPYNQRRQSARLHSWARCARTRTKT